VEQGKPAPDLFLHAASTMQVHPDRCVVVEDSRYGVAAARSAGMRVVGFAGGITPPHHLADADVVITDMAVLPETIDGLLPGGELPVVPVGAEVRDAAAS
jgi:beta-phosphoglucomutase-like phosphatase (HAD superfamily)